MTLSEHQLKRQKLIESFVEDYLEAEDVMVKLELLKGIISFLIVPHCRPKLIKLFTVLDEIFKQK